MSGHPHAANPYRLYAASSLGGSFVTLMTYPFVVEPLFTLRTQILTWSVGYAVSIVLTAAAAVVVRPRGQTRSHGRPGHGRRSHDRQMVHLVSFVVLALACNGELYRRRPEPARLTEFYLWTSFGGVIGGIFAGLIAPHVFNGIAEYPILILAALLAMPGAFAGGPSRFLRQSGPGLVLAARCYPHVAPGSRSSQRRAAGRNRANSPGWRCGAGPAAPGLVLRPRGARLCHC